MLLLVLCALFLGMILFSLDWSQQASKDLVKSIEGLRDQQTKDAAALRAEVAKMRQGLERRLSTLKIRGVSTSDGESDPPLPRAELLASAAKGSARPIGGMLVNSRAEPSTLNRWVTNEGITRTIMNYVHDGLFNLNPLTLEPRPALATRWEVSDDKLKYRFFLRKGVVFSDGTPFTAHDVKFTVDLIMDPNVKSDIHKPQFEDVARIEVVNDHEIVFHYKRKYWRGIYALGNSIRVNSAKWIRAAVEAQAAKDRDTYPKGSYSTEPGGEKFGELYNEIQMPSVGTGPYRFDEEKSWIRSVSLTIYRSPTSWWFRDYVGKWNLAAQRWRWIREDSVLWEEVKKRNVDVRVVDSDKWVDSFSKDQVLLANFNKFQYDHVGIGHSYIVWNNRKEMFKDARVRNAMTHLIDRKTMLEDFDYGIGTYATCIFKRWYPEYSTDLEPKLLDIKRARALLEEAGWVDSNGDGIREKDGKDFRFQMMVPSGRKEYLRWGQLWQGHMKRAGIDMQIRPTEWSSFIQLFYDRSFDACCLYASHTDPWIEPYEEYLETQVGPKQANASGWVNREAIDIITKARTEFDPIKRRELFHRFNQLHYDEKPTTLLLHGEVIVVLDKRFKGVVVKKRGMTPEDWWVPEDERLYDDQGFRIR